MPVRWAGKQVVETVPVQVTKELEVKEVLLVDESLRSPGESKPMQRKFKYQSTPEAAEVDPEYAEEVHEKNLLEHGRVIKDFEMAEQQQGRIAARHRKQLQYARNRQQYGTARAKAASGSGKAEGLRYPHHCSWAGKAGPCRGPAVRKHCCLVLLVRPWRRNCRGRACEHVGTHV